MQLAWNTDWLTAAKRLVERSFELCDTQTSNAVYESFCESAKIDAKIEDSFTGRKRYKRVKEFAESTKGDSTGYIVSVPHHLVFVKTENTLMHGTAEMKQLEKYGNLKSK